MIDLEGCEAILWRQGSHRCELWCIAGAAELRVFIADELMCCEPIGAGTLMQRSAELLCDAQASMRAAWDSTAH